MKTSVYSSGSVADHSRLQFMSGWFRRLTGLAMLSLTPIVYAGNTWDGGGGSPFNWSVNANWSSDTAPTYGTLTFAGTVGNTNIMDANRNMNQLNWTGTSAWGMNSSGGATLSLFDNGGTQAKLEATGSGNVTINANITFAANNGSPPNPFGEINAVNADMTFSGGTVTVNGSSCNGIKLFGGSRVLNFNSTVSASGKWFGHTTSGTGNTVNIGGAFTSSDFYVMNAGTLNLNSGGTLTTSVRLGGDFGNTGNQNLTKSGTFNLTALTGGQTFSGVINSVSGNTSGALTVNSQNTSGTNTLSGHPALDSALKITQAAGGALAITQVKGGDNSTGTDIKGQTLTLTPAAGGTIIISGTIYNSTGSGAVVMNGTGTLVLSGTNTFGGATTISSGVVNIRQASALGGTGGATTVSSGAALQLQSGITTSAEPLTLNGGGVAGDGALRNVSDNNTFLGNVTLASDVRVASDSGTLTLSGTTDFQNPGGGVSRTLTVSGVSDTSISGNLINAATGESALTKTNAGTLTLGGNNAVRVLYNHGGGVISISAAGNIGVPTGVNYPDKFNFTDDATLRVNANSFTLGSNIGGSDNAGFRIASGKTGTFDIAGGSTLTIDGVIANISGNGNLAKTGAGTLSLAQPNTFSGNTTVSAGTLALAGVGSVAASPIISIDAAAVVNSTARADGTLTLASGQTLKGNGTVVGVLAGANGSTLAPGTSVGALTNTGALLLQGGGTNVVEVIDVAGGAGVGNDYISVTGDIGVQATSGNQFNLKLVSLNGSGAAGGVTNFNNDTSYTWNVASGNVTNFDAAAFRIDTDSFSNDLAGGEFVLAPGSLNLRFTNNHAPVANVASYVRGRGAGIKIPVANLLEANTSDQDGDARSLLSLGSSTNGAFVTNTGSYIMIAPTNDLPETISYTVRDLRAAYRAGDTVRTATALIDLSVSNAIGVVNITNTGGGSMTVSFYGIPGYDYVIQRSSNLVDWVDVATNTTPAGGLVQLTETPPHNPAFYRTRTE
jgi:fibronectin-binding autotransporter adhesin